MALENFPKIADYQIARTGVLHSYRYILGTDCISELNLQYILFYFQENDASPTLVATLTARTKEDCFQHFSLYAKSKVSFELINQDFSIDDFLSYAHSIAQKHLEIGDKEWHPPLQHYPILSDSVLLDYGSVEDYHYELHYDCTSTEFVQYNYILYCFPLQQRVPSLVLYIEQNADDNGFEATGENIGCFTTQKHHTEPLEVKLGSHKAYLKLLLSIAESYLRSPVEKPENETSTLSFPVLELGKEEIKKVLHIETLYELSLLSTIMLLVGHVFSTMGSLPYFGWLFSAVWFVSWLLSSLLALVAQRARQWR